jgi:quercetin dioxygenase-like cupin family protein
LQEIDMSRTTVALACGVAAALIVVSRLDAQSTPSQSAAPAAVTRTDLLSRDLPPGNFRHVQSAIVTLPPGTAAVRHRHDVAVLAYVLEGTVENQFNAGAVETHKTGESWYEAPGTVHDIARNSSTTAQARLLIVYIAEEGKRATVPLQ